MTKIDQQQITQHKRFVPYGTHPNPTLYVLSEGRRFCRTNAVRFHNESKLYSLEDWTSFMLNPLGEILRKDK